MSKRSGRAPLLSCVLLTALPAQLACNGNPAARGGFPPPAVETVTLEPAPIERATEYIATLRSRRSSTLQPMVDGTVTRIAVRSGDRVRAGDVVLEIDDSRQRATVASLNSLRIAREADLAYARREAERQRDLFRAGAASEQEAERAATGVETAEAQLAAVAEQIREQEVQLAYYRVTAPTGGVIGDVPVRVGDRVTDSTVLTTIDMGGGLELYLHVPVRNAAGLVKGLPVRILDDEGAVLADTSLDFVSPQVDEATQTVLAKAPLPDSAGFRTEQQVRARIVWSASPGLRVPVVAVSRISGRYFAFVAVEEEGATVARQRGIELGPIVGNDYVVLDGLAPGDRLIVAGIQKVRDGAPIDPQPRPTPER
jgi:RND family efflux transporter MFP subunit